MAYWQRRLQLFGLAVSILVVILAASVSPAGAADGVLNTPSPAGVPLTLPGLVWLPGSHGGHVWVSDGRLLFCRLDSASNGFTDVNGGTCDSTAKTPAQVALDPTPNADGTRFLYVADQSATSSGAVRLTFDPKSETVVRGSGVLLGDGATTGLRASSIAIGPVDGKLYLGFVKSGDLMRITNPRGAAGQQSTEIVGRTSDGRGVLGGLAFVRKDLYIGEVGGNGVTAIADPSTCNALGVGGGCQATVTPITTNFPGGLTSDGQDVLFVGDSAITNAGTVLRYRVSTDTQDTVSSTVPSYTSSFDGVHNRYAAITGLTVGPNGDLYVGDDPTLRAARPPTLQGHVWKLAGVAQATAECAPAATPPVIAGCIDALGSPAQPAPIPSPKALASPATLIAYGQTSPSGIVWMPSSSGGHLWVGDHTQGLCRLDPTPVTAGSLQVIDTTQPTACDKGGVIGSPGQAVYDPTANSDGSHFVYVPDDAVKSPGLWRLTFDPQSETINNPTLMAPGAGLDNNRLIGVALGPDGNVYAAGLKNGFIYRITRPRGSPTQMAVDVIGQTTDARGINGTLAFVGNDLYLPENRGASVMRGATNCGNNGAPCVTSLLPIPGLIFGQSVASNGKDAVYVSTAAGGSSAVVYRYTPGSGAVTVYAALGALPPAILADGTANPAAVEYCSETCVRRPDPETPFGGLVGFHFAIGMYVDPTTGNLLIADDPAAGTRGFHGHIWSVTNVP